MVKKSDFILAPYMKSSDLRATWQIANTLVPYLVLWGIAAPVASISLWLLPPIVILMVLFSLRSFSLMHDCGHYSLFTSKWMNRLVGFGLGAINAVPQYAWSRDHAYHHKTNGDWERYRGIGDFLSTTEFAQLTAFKQKLYGLLRHPVMSLPGGFFYLAIKPRISLILGIFEFIRHGFSRLGSNKKNNISSIPSPHRSNYWQTRGEFWDLLLNNVCVFSSWLLLSQFMGVKLFFGLYSVVLTLAGASFICIFFVQHNFPGSYAHKTENWDFVRGAIEGSSYLELPAILRWFTADIGYHNIHHLSERIPNYHLADCHQQNRHLLAGVKVVRISDMLNCAQYILWDADTNALVSIKVAMSNYSRLPCDAAATPKLQQLQHYLQRPGFIPAATHPFVKQAALSQPPANLAFSRGRLVVGWLSLVGAWLRAGFAAIASGGRRSPPAACSKLANPPAPQQWTHSQPPGWGSDDVPPSATPPHPRQPTQPRN